MLVFVFFFFFSSRRRHTISLRDWSSDVCSSDLTAGWALAVMAGVFTAIACGSSDAHLNPAVTIGFAVRDGDFTKFGPYLVAQMLGAIAGAALVWLQYFPHWKETPDESRK